MARRRDVVVVGGGVMGSATAWWLARAGADVALVEQFGPGHDRGSSHGASRVFRLVYGDPLYASFAQTSLRLWKELEEEAGEELLTRTGGIDHGDEASIQGIASALSSVSASFEFMRPEEVTERWQGIRTAGAVLFQPDTGVLAADATVASLQRCASARGAEIRFEEPVGKLEPADGGVVVATDREEIQATVVVVTAGAWLARLVDGIVRLPPLRITQEQPVYFAHARDAVWPVVIHRFTPDAGDQILSGLGAYAVPTPGHGVKVGEHGTGPVVDPGDRTPPDPAGIDRLRRYVERWFPGLDPKPREVISCLYTTTPDEHFVVDRAGPFVIGSPCSGHGFKFAPALGRMLADLALGGPVRPPQPWRTVRADN